ncbi:MAG: VanZ family protein [Sphingobacteriales bacterium]|nr:MAG: VanZ family protein [Sphingobacteriales bacterium]
MIKKYWYSYWPGLLWTIAIFILLILPGSSFPKKKWFGEIYLDKWIHIFLFASFVILWSLVAKHQSVSKKKNLLLKLMIAGILFGVMMEVIQHFWVPSRSFEVKDIMADGAGAFIGWLYCKRKLK